MAAIQFVRKAWWDVPHPIHFVIGTARDELSKNKRVSVRLEIEHPNLMSKLIKLARSRSIHSNQV